MSVLTILTRELAQWAFIMVLKTYVNTDNTTIVAIPRIINSKMIIQFNCLDNLTTDIIYIVDL